MRRSRSLRKGGCEMWWINRFGNVSGPYSDEQIRQGIWRNQFTKLNKISADGQTWTWLGETEFWRPVVRIPKPVREVAKRFDLAEGGKPVGPLASSDARSVPQRRKIARLVICGVAVCFALTFAVLGLMRWGRHASSREITPMSQKTRPDFEFVKRRVVLVHTKSANGTAFLVSMDGKKYVMTNEHVVRCGASPEMVLVDGTKLVLGEMSIARDRDLARFEVSCEGEAFEVSEKVPNNNDEVWVYGNSSGDDVITSLRGFVTGVGSRVIKTNAEFVGGNSGSPIVGTDGKVVAVASYLKNGSNGKDWTKKDTQFDGVRRFGTRLANVEWVKIDRRKYEKDCQRLKTMEVYWWFLWDYLVCADVSDENLKLLKLEHKDVDRKKFGEDDGGFHEMLMALSRAYANQGKTWDKWKSIVRDRDALIDRLNDAMDAGDMSRANAEKQLDRFDRERRIDATWENVKSRHREFNAKQKEALLMARRFLSENDWNPLMKQGYSDSQTEPGCVNWYLETIQCFLDQNAQNLKDLDKALKTLEGKDED